CVALVNQPIPAASRPHRSRSASAELLPLNQSDVQNSSAKIMITIGRCRRALLTFGSVIILIQPCMIIITTAFAKSPELDCLNKGTCACRQHVGIADEYAAFANNP